MNTIKISEELHSKLSATFVRLTSLGVASVAVEFSGSGDEGEIQDITYDPSEKSETIENSDLHEEIESLSSDLLHEYGYNWYDNEGGYGVVRYAVEAKTFAVELHQYVTETVDVSGRGELHG